MHYLATDNHLDVEVIDPRHNAASYEIGYREGYAGRRESDTTCQQYWQGLRDGRRAAELDGAK